MLKPICLALFCLSLVGALLAVRTTIAARAVAEPAISQPVSGIVPEAEDDDRAPLAKGDRLPFADFDSKKVPVIPIEAAPIEKNEATRIEKTEAPATEKKEAAPVEKKDPPPVARKEEKKTSETATAEETVSWHWHVGSKISKRTGKPVQ
jgi:hypothetical protein